MLTDFQRAKKDVDIDRCPNQISVSPRFSIIVTSRGYLAGATGSSTAFDQLTLDGELGSKPRPRAIRGELAEVRSPLIPGHRA